MQQPFQPNVGQLVGAMGNLNIGQPQFQVQQPQFQVQQQAGAFQPGPAPFATVPAPVQQAGAFQPGPAPFATAPMSVQQQQGAIPGTVAVQMQPQQGVISPVAQPQWQVPSQSQFQVQQPSQAVPSGGTAGGQSFPGWNPPQQGPPIPSAVSQQFQPVPKQAPAPQPFAQPQFTGGAPAFSGPVQAYQPPPQMAIPAWRPLIYNAREPNAEPLTLFPEQVPHFQRVMGMVNDPRLKYFWDVSEPGTGKSWIEGGLSEALLPRAMREQFGIKNVPILWITPKMVKAKVQGFLQVYGLANYGVISYTEIIGRGNNQPTHGFLQKLANGQYVASPAFQEIVNNLPGLLLIIDESHNIKNQRSQQSAAVTGLVRATMASPYGLVAFLSATPLDKPQHAYAYLQALGFMTDEPGKKIASNEFGRGFALGTGGEAIASIYQVDPNATARILARHNAQITGIGPDRKAQVVGISDTKKLRLVLHELFRDVVYGPRHSRMIMPKRADTKNLLLFYPLEVLQQLDKLVLGAKAATGYSDVTGTASAKAVAGETVGTYTRQINNLLMSRVPEWLSNFLNKNPEYKAVIFSKSVEAVEWAAASLKPWNPLYQTGKTDSSIRQSLMEKFQAPTNQYRIFISTTKTGGIGIDLDDKSEGGRFPRICIIMPDFDLIDHIQALGRVLRMSTKSVPLLRTVYPINYPGTSLQNITTAVIAKSDTLREFTDKENERANLNNIYGVNISYPNEYPSELEPAPPNDGRIYPPAVKQDEKPGI